ncbi:DUF1684 domain-containing protein [Microbacterium sp. M3]|uniref:DUF1684 domain-containing protein n=1 Tax=Microbacterium arthrosphaerae TaxID=792652 RepID=A0ABU4GXZ1_9MICO|nr:MULTISPECIES: DUF1684 domain-containing protein [Microbacterium]MDW4571948.1 DUF1684 domain-containing protein [Microbacterium arthrosphaerae]MDW7605803.1 DUF1684 domain-containing protein [Microbacterium sp. M3]
MTLPTGTTETLTDERWLAVSSAHGIAALRHTHWLDDRPRAYEGAPGLWRAADGAVIGSGLHGRDDLASEASRSEVRLAPGEHLDIGGLRLKAISRGGVPALRVFDPEAPSRTRLRGILSFPHADAWAIPGLFRPAAAGTTTVIESVDGSEREEPAVGTIALQIAGAPVELTVTGDPAEGLSAVIADATGNVDAYRFRFLEIDPPAADGSVIVDFNRAYLPPCAFSEHYICPLPPANNRLAVRVDAGERIAEVA